MIRTSSGRPSVRWSAALLPAILLLPLLLGTPEEARAGAGAVDSSFKVSIASGQVNTVAIQTDGRILLGGRFRFVNGQSRRGLVRLTREGAVDTSFRADLAVPVGNFSADTVTIQSDGKIIVGGAFETINGIPSRNLARLKQDGTVDPTFTQSIFPAFNTGAINVVKPAANGALIVGGSFEVLNQRNVGAVAGSGAVLTTFRASAIGSPSPVTALAVQKDGSILVGGSIRTFNGQAQIGIARLRPDGSLDTSFKPGVDGPVNAIAIGRKNKIIIGGDFETVGGKVRSVIARLNKNGTLDRSFRFSGFAQSSGGVSVNTILVARDGKILAGGSFFYVAGGIRHDVVRLNDSGKIDRSFRSEIPAGGLSVGGGVSSLAVQRDGRILVGGSFGGLHGDATSSIARLRGR